ncbi:hypothetical protein K493DRAFT_303328 [Basidiobolus meristosporus CBS 931.73]|uniref:Fucosyltransferase n=1 Tax=Basidiobolus meristosporus CBS 931.73 TaxID=1314790 RepID=A0A1Y1Y348_9FUNG|nr:hypothetical protein K493DRAFT_303328 [Basidiobolus meristosporus CBS 931.73]|eukprot:ORX92423.1 hypothetical protein K493DRAFT_303328 [Basidiobolus meristosporus CBS 931.73]
MAENYSILYWTKFFGEPILEGQNVDYCGYPYTCTFTYNREEINSTSLLIFHAPDYNPRDLPAPIYRDKAIKTLPWILNTAEAPVNDPWQLDARKLKDFEYSSTYRRDSHFPISYFGAELLDYVRRPQIPRANSTNHAPIAWIVSNCKAKNKRHYYVRELMKYIDIDIYGHCMNNKEWPKDKPIVEVIQNYKFYLALENSNCQDYVTEKLENAIAAGAVPIVDGPATYDFVAPTKNAFINVNSFEHPKQLATYLKNLLANPHRYEQLLSYKKDVKLTDAFHKGWDFYGKKGLDALPPTKRSYCNLCRVSRDIAVYKRNHPSATPEEFWTFATTQLDPQPQYASGIQVDDTCVINKWSIYRPNFLVLYFWQILLFIVLLWAIHLYRKRNPRTFKHALAHSYRSVKRRFRGNGVCYGEHMI